MKLRRLRRKFRGLLSAARSGSATNRGAARGEVSKNGITPLMKAASAGDLPAVLQALSEGAEVDARDAFSYTALSYASAAGHEHVVEALLLMGAKADSENIISLTPKKLAQSRGYSHIAEVLGLEEEHEDARAADWMTESDLENVFESWQHSVLIPHARKHD